MLTEIFVPCYFGSVVTQKSNEITRHIYESNWIPQTEKYKQAYRIFVERTFYPIKLHAGGYFVLGLETMLKVNFKYITKIYSNFN